MEKSARQELLLKIQEMDFSALDLALYLNTHPTCERALAIYKETVREAEILRREFEEKYGPLTAARSSSKTPWQWIEDPWTWDKERS